jgi:endonuclease-3
MGRGPAKRIAAVLDRLETRYGPQIHNARYEPMDELVSCILTQHTTDATAFPTFDRLKETYPTWQQVVDAGEAKIAKVIARVGLANQKAKAIIATLKEIKNRTGDYSIDHLAKLPMLEARDWLTSLPGVGPKTASIVLCFAFGKEAIPVDTHIHRVSRRLAFVPDKADANKAHDILLDLVDEKDAYRYHTLLIQHGRETCKAQRPKCLSCIVYDLCPWPEKPKR